MHLSHQHWGDADWWVTGFLWSASKVVLWSPTGMNTCMHTHTNTHKVNSDSDMTVCLQDKARKNRNEEKKIASGKVMCEKLLGDVSLSCWLVTVSADQTWSPDLPL